MTVVGRVFAGAPVAALCILDCTGAAADSRGYLTTPEELTTIRQKADEGIEPYKDAVAEVLSRANEGWNFILTADTTCDGSDDPVWNDNQGGTPILYAKALAYHLTGDTRYAEEVKNILQRIMTEVETISVSEHQCRLNFGWGTPELVASADLIEDYWKDQTCTGPTSTLYDVNTIGSGECKTLFQNWLIKNPYYVVSYATAGSASNWGAAATNAAMYIADYLWDRPEARLVHRNPRQVNGGMDFIFSSAEAYNFIKDITLKRMSMHGVELGSSSSCDYLSGPQQNSRWPPVKSGITEKGIIPEDARREEYCNIPQYNGEYQQYPQIHLSNLIQQCELMRRRGDTSCFDNVDMTDVPQYTFAGPDGVLRTTHLYPGRGSVERAINAIIIDSVTEWKRGGALWVAYSYYLDSKRLPETDLSRWASYLDDGAGGCGQDICFGTLTHGFASDGNPETSPLVTLSTARLTFAEQNVGTASDPQALSLSNTGEGLLVIDSIAVTGDFAETNDCGASVAAGGSCTISVTFAPTVEGPVSGTLTINSNAPDSPHAVNLSGTGTGFSLDVSSGSSTSATVMAGQTATYDLTISPDGFSGDVSLTCTENITAAACSVSPSSVTLDGSTPAEVEVSVTTTARSMAPPSMRLPPPGGSGRLTVPWSFWLLVLVMLASVVIPARRRVRWGLAVTMLSVLLWIGCGGEAGPAPPPQAGTPAGTYTITVTATAGELSHSTDLTLTVN